MTFYRILDSFLPIIAVMSDYVPIACGDYDYLEIACLDGYEIELTCGNDQIVGVARSMQVRDGEESICLVLPDSTDRVVRADRIEHMKVMTRPARFHEHHFACSS